MGRPDPNSFANIDEITQTHLHFDWDVCAVRGSQYACLGHVRKICGADEGFCTMPGVFCAHTEVLLYCLLSLLSFLPCNLIEFKRGDNSIIEYTTVIRSPAKALLYYLFCPEI